MNHKESHYPQMEKKKLGTEWPAYQKYSVTINYIQQYHHGDHKRTLHSFELEIIFNIFIVFIS